MRPPDSNGFSKAASPQELSRRAHDLYDRLIRPAVEPAHNGEFIVLNTQTGEYEMDPDDIAASKRAVARFPAALLYTMRVGHDAAYRLGRSSQARSAC
jgi:hypothetical protein